MSESKNFHHDDFEKEAELLFEAYSSDTKNYGLLRKASALYNKSKNPERQQISQLLLGLYYREEGINTKDDAEAARILHKAINYIIKSTGIDSIETKRIKLEYLNRKLLASGNKPPKELFLERANIFKELKDNVHYNIDMSLYYMRSMIELPPFDVKAKDLIELMLYHAKESGKQEFIYRMKAFYHRAKASMKFTLRASMEEIQESLNNVEKTSDRYGENVARANLSYLKGLLTSNKSERSKLMLEAVERWKNSGMQGESISAINMLMPLPIKASIIMGFADQALEKLNLMGKKIHELIKIKPGPYAIFHHHSHMIERIKDVRLVIKRLGESRKKITDLSIRAESLRPKKTRPGKPFSKKLQAIMKRQHDLTDQMKLDMESLYVFGNLLLDQWSYVIKYSIGIDSPKDFGFYALYDKISSEKDIGLLSLIRENHRKDIYWLCYQLRAYRNIFIEHVRRPWQRGNTMSVYGDDFNLFIPTPPGWLDGEQIRKRLQAIYHLAPKALRDAPDDYWEKRNLHRVLEITFMHIDQIDKKDDREKVWDVWKDIGGSTPSYDIVGHRLMSFIVNSIPTLMDIITKNPEKINLGRP